MAADSIERGMQSVPRGLSAGLTSYLNSLDAVVRRLAGLSRGADEARAVRRSEASGLGVGGYGQGAVASAMLHDDAVTSRKIAAGAVTSEKIAAGAVTGEKLAAGVVGERHLAEHAVTTGKLANSSVTGDRLAAGAVAEAHLADRAVTAGKLALGVVGERHLADNAVTTGKLADASVTGDKLRAASVTERELSDRCVGGDELKPRCVAAIHIEDGVLHTSMEGVAAHGETVNLGAWLERPVVAVAGFVLSAGTSGILRAGIENPRQNDGSWLFDVVACRDMGEDENGVQTVIPGEITWFATGRRRTTNNG